MSLSKNSKKLAKNSVVFGVSFSLKQCRNFGLDWQPVLESLINEMGIRRFRLMSYWDEHEPNPGGYDFAALDAQIAVIKQAGGAVSLCLGVRQPRWPENHWPSWAWQLPEDQRNQKLLEYIETVVTRYKNVSVIMDYQLENEALLENFGERSHVDKVLLRLEYALVKHLDPSRRIIMTTSTSWGIPVQLVPDIVGFSYYQVLFRAGKYRHSFHKPWLDRWRARVIRWLFKKPSFIHELQAEPWGPANIWEMPLDEQYRSMSPLQLRINISQARATRLKPIDLWGGEWWYWLKNQGQPEIWNTVLQEIKN